VPFLLNVFMLRLFNKRTGRRRQLSDLSQALGLLHSRRMWTTGELCGGSKGGVFRQHCSSRSVAHLPPKQLPLLSVIESAVERQMNSPPNGEMVVV